MSRIAVIDYGMGNLHSIAKALEHVSARGRVIVSGDPAVLRRAGRLVFPGVGAIADCMSELHRLGLDEVIREAVGSRPVLGICLGMQALLEGSDENDGVACLGLLRGRIRRFDRVRDEAGRVLRVPHMGWNRVEPAGEHPLWTGIEPGSRFYFVHSYYAPADCEGAAAWTTHGVRFASALAADNLFAVQFHPEKSQQAGLALLQNFVHWDGEVVQAAGPRAAAGR